MKKLTPMQFFAMLICTRAFSMMTFLPESTANALELMLGTVLSTVFQIVMICGMAAFHKRFPNDDPCTLVVSRSKWAGRGVCTLYLAYFLTVSFYVIGTFTYYMDYYFSDFSIHFVIASITAARKPFSSSTRTASMVVPPGEQTISFSAPGCSPVSSTIFAEPITA